MCGKASKQFNKAEFPQRIIPKKHAFFGTKMQLFFGGAAKENYGNQKR